MKKERITKMKYTPYVNIQTNGYNYVVIEMETSNS